MNAAVKMNEKAGAGAATPAYRLAGTGRTELEAHIRNLKNYVLKSTPDGSPWENTGEAWKQARAACIASMDILDNLEKLPEDSSDDGECQEESVFVSAKMAEDGTIRLNGCEYQSDFRNLEPLKVEMYPVGTGDKMRVFYSGLYICDAVKIRNIY